MRFPRIDDETKSYAYKRSPVSAAYSSFISKGFHDDVFFLKLGDICLGREGLHKQCVVGPGSYSSKW